MIRDERLKEHKEMLEFEVMIVMRVWVMKVTAMKIIAGGDHLVVVLLLFFYSFFSPFLTRLSSWRWRRKSRREQRLWKKRMTSTKCCFSTVRESHITCSPLHNSYLLHLCMCLFWVWLRRQPRAGGGKWRQQW